MASGAGSYWVLTRLRSLPDVINTLNGERQLVTAALRARRQQLERTRGNLRFIHSAGLSSISSHQALSRGLFREKLPPVGTIPTANIPSFLAAAPAALAFASRLASRLLPTAVSPALLIHAIQDSFKISPPH